MTETISRANQKKHVVASNLELDYRLLQEREPIGQTSSGTLVAYDKPGKPFDSELVYTDPISSQRYAIDTSAFKGEKDIALAINHGFFKNEHGEIRPVFAIYEGRDFVVQIIQSSQLGIIEDFPKTNGVYHTDQKFGIPHGQQFIREVLGNPYPFLLNPSIYCGDARYLLRVHNGPYIGLIARSSSGSGAYADDSHYDHYVVANQPPSTQSGARLECEF